MHLLHSAIAFAQSCFSHPNETRGETIYHFCLEAAAIVLVALTFAAFGWVVLS